MTAATPTLAALIAGARQAQGLSMQRLADRCGLSKAHVWNLERRDAMNPTVEVLAALADALGLPPIQLLDAALVSQGLRPKAAA